MLKNDSSISSCIKGENIDNPKKIIDKQKTLNLKFITYFPPQLQMQISSDIYQNTQASIASHTGSYLDSQRFIQQPILPYQKIVNSSDATKPIKSNQRQRIIVPGAFNILQIYIFRHIQTNQSDENYSE